MEETLKLPFCALTRRIFCRTVFHWGAAACCFPQLFHRPGFTGMSAAAEKQGVFLCRVHFQGIIWDYILPEMSVQNTVTVKKSAPVVAEYLYAMTAGKTGNYMVYFPSYAYLTMVLELFEEAHPEIVTLVQQPGMDDAAREEFLSHFSETPDRTLLGFGVMGGVFGEGIDLTGERLIGTAVVGVGLPMVSPRQEKLREYMENRFGSGFDYAYRFPGMNRVLQAAGRVIRTAVDRGVVLLLDDRYLTAGYRMLCPPHWNGAEIVRSPEQLYQLEEDFWERKDETGGNGIISSR